MSFRDGRGGFVGAGVPKMTPAQEARSLVAKRIQVAWNSGEAWNFYDSPEDAYEAVKLLKISGFDDSVIAWPLVPVESTPEEAIEAIEIATIQDVIKDRE